MTRIFSIVSFLALGLLACSDDAPTSAPRPATPSGPRVEFVSGDQVVALDPLDAQRMQDGIVRAVEGLWEATSSGGTVEFHVRGQRTSDLGTEPTDAEREAPEEPTVHLHGQMQLSIASTPYRLFRGRDGACGLEEAVDEPTGPELHAGPDVEWADIESDLRERAFPVALLRGMFMSKKGS